MTTDQRRPEFPICKDPAKFQPESQLGVVTANARRAVEALQPFKWTDGTDEDPLAILHALWNWDKHNAIHVVAAHYDPPKIPGQITTPGVYIAEPGPVHDGQVLARLPLDGFQVVNDDPNPMSLSFQIEPAFGAPGPAAGRRLGPTLATICSYVSARVMGALERVILEVSE